MELEVYVLYLHLILYSIRHVKGWAVVRALSRSIFGLEKGDCRPDPSLLLQHIAFEFQYHRLEDVNTIQLDKVETIRTNGYRAIKTGAGLDRLFK